MRMCAPGSGMRRLNPERARVLGPAAKRAALGPKHRRPILEPRFGLEEGRILSRSASEVRQQDPQVVRLVWANVLT